MLNHSCTNSVQHTTTKDQIVQSNSVPRPTKLQFSDKSSQNSTNLCLLSVSYEDPDSQGHTYTSTSVMSTEIQQISSNLFNLFGTHYPDVKHWS